MDARYHDMRAVWGRLGTREDGWASVLSQLCRERVGKGQLRSPIVSKQVLVEGIL